MVLAAQNDGEVSRFGSLCERILRAPTPLVYTRHTSRFLLAWCLFLPLGLYTVTIPAPPRAATAEPPVAHPTRGRVSSGDR